MTPTLRSIYLAVHCARTTVDRPVALHATDATWRAVLAELAPLGQSWRDWPGLAGMRVYSTARSSRVVTACGAEVLLDPPVRSEPSPVLKNPERRREVILADHHLPEITHGRP